MPPSSIFLIPENQLGMLRPLKPPRLQGEAETFCPPLPPPPADCQSLFRQPYSQSRAWHAVAPPRIRGTDEQGERRMRAADQQDDSWDVCLVPAVSPGLRPSRGPHKHTATVPEDRVSPPTIRPLVLPSARPEETGRLRTSHTSPGSQPDGRQAWAWLCLCPPAPHPAAAPRDRAWPWTLLRHHLRPAGAPRSCAQLTEVTRANALS